MIIISIEIDMLYFIIAIVIILISSIGAYIHKTLIPLAWGLTVGGILILFSQYLEPALFGFWIYGYTLIGFISLAFLILWGFLIVQSLYNIVKDGQVIV